MGDLFSLKVRSPHGAEGRRTCASSFRSRRRRRPRPHATLVSARGVSHNDSEAAVGWQFAPQLASPRRRASRRSKRLSRRRPSQVLPAPRARAPLAAAMQESLSSTSLASSTCGHGPECKAEGCANAAFHLWLSALDDDAVRHTGLEPRLRVRVRIRVLETPVAVRPGRRRGMPRRPRTQDEPSQGLVLLLTRVRLALGRPPSLPTPQPTKCCS